MSKKISVIIKEPGKDPRHVNISDSLKNLQRTVGGYIETLTFATDACIICNEEGRLQGLPYCCTFFGAELVGTIIMVGVNGEEFTDWPMAFADTKRLFPGLWEV
ncbi:MAG: DUF3846 domain-containing protein [Clostridiales bacterium]|nr:DUF3846 domain-containing protein [Candidatus Cacconaster stercorequi]